MVYMGKYRALCVCVCVCVCVCPDPYRTRNFIQSVGRMQNFLVINFVEQKVTTRPYRVS